MTLDQFIAKYDGKFIDFDGHYGNQCVDLYRQYVKEVLSYPQSPGVTGAKDVWDTYLRTHYTRLENTIDAIPQKGDIIIWGEGAGPYGHIAICVEASQLTFKSFDQNYPVGSNCHIQLHRYNNVLGWLRPNDIMSDDMPEYLKGLLNDQLQIDITDSEGDVRGRVGEIVDKLRNYDNLQKNINKLEKENIGLEGEIGKLEREFQALSESRDRLTKENEEIRRELITAQTKISKSNEEIEALNERITTLEEAMDPEKYVVLKVEEVQRLMKRKTTDRLTDAELLRAWLERKWEALRGIFRRGGE